MGLAWAQTTIGMMAAATGERNAMTYETVNQAIVDHYAVTGLTDATKEAIRRDAGEDGLALIHEMSSFANQPEIWVHAESHTQAYNDVQRLLQDTYPFLRADAVLRIATSAAYGWK
jgi:hypothetical protein